MTGTEPTDLARPYERALIIESIRQYHRERSGALGDRS